MFHYIAELLQVPNQAEAQKQDSTDRESSWKLAFPLFPLTLPRNLHDSTAILDRYRNSMKHLEVWILSNH